MAKQSGLGHRLAVSGYDLSGDVGEVSRIGGGPALIEVTGMDKSAFERIGGLRDGSIEFKAFFNTERASDNPGVTTDRAHARFSLLPTADQLVTYFAGTTLGDPAGCCVAKQLNYDPKRSQSGELTFDISAEANGYGVEWCRQLTAFKRTDTAAANGSSVDFGVGSTAFGLQAYLHVFAFTGTSVTVKLQESSDDGAGDAWADVTGGGFTAASGITSQRIETSRTQTVERYLRVVTTGTFSNAVFAVVVNRNDIATAF